MIGRHAVTSAIGLGVVLRVGVACWNGLDGPSFGATADAANFHRFAIAVSEGQWAPGAGLTGFSYAYTLGLLYRVTGPSLLLGSLLSCLAWLTSALTVRASLRHLHVAEPAQFATLLIYALLPSSVLWTAVTLREPYELLSVNLTLYAVLLLLDRRSVAAWLLLLGSVLLGALLHGALLVVGALVIGGLILREAARMFATPWARAVAVGAIMMAVVFGGGYAFRSMYAKYNFTGGPAAAMERHLRTGMLQPSRTVYISDPTVGSTAELAIALPIALLQYLFEPMPWKMNRWIDLGFLAENVLRLVMIALAVATALSNPQQGRLVWPLVVWYLAMETVWAVGTFNWGTAARHHLPATGLLLTAASVRWASGPLPLRSSRE